LCVKKYKNSDKGNVYTPLMLGGFEALKHYMEEKFGDLCVVTEIIYTSVKTFFKLLL
jgi:hypothetical protein